MSLRGEIAACVHQNHVIRVRPDKGRLLPEFLNAYFNSIAGRQEMFERSRTTSGLFKLGLAAVPLSITECLTVT
jgi:type I restriction enzyme, S subunit